MNANQFQSIKRTLRFTNDQQGACTLTKVDTAWDDNTPAEENTKRVVLSNANTYWRAQGNSARYPQFNNRPQRWAGESKPRYEQCYLPTGYYEWVKENKED